MRFASEPEEDHVHGPAIGHGVLDVGARPEKSRADGVGLMVFDVGVEGVNGED